MADEQRLHREPDVVEALEVERHELGGRVPRVGGRPQARARFVDEGEDLRCGFLRRGGGLRARRSDDLGEAPNLGFADLRRPDGPPAVDEVVDFVDEQERSVEGCRVAQTRERDDGVECVVVVAEDDVGPLRQLEGDFERTDLLGPRLLEDEVGLQMRSDGEEPVDEAGRLELGGVVFRVRAVVLVAEDDAVRAHPLLGPEADRAGRGGGDRLQGLPKDLLLGRLRGEDVELSPSPESLYEHRQEGRRSLADAGRGLDEELLPGAHGSRHGGHHFALSRSEAPERKDELVRLG